MNEKNLKEIANSFSIKGNTLSCLLYGEGHINDTFLVSTDGGERYILQRINDQLFTNIPALMQNIYLVTEFNRKKVIEKGGNPDRESLTVILTKGKRAYLECADGYFRMYLFIGEATSYQRVEKESDFYEAAKAFGGFANMLSEFDATQLYEVLPNFHNTVLRYQTFIEAVQKDAFLRAKEVQAEIEWVKSHAYLKNCIVDKLNSKEMPLKVTHNDTKFNNIMIDDKTGKAIAVIDLDTIMPGSLCYDFGDSIRFGCNPAAEDEPDLSKVNFKVNLFKAFAKGYLQAVGSTITKCEKDNLVNGALVMTFECGMRFLTDYLNGDVYFKTHRPGHNIDRARTQFKMVNDMLKIEEELNAIIHSL